MTATTSTMTRDELRIGVDHHVAGRLDEAVVHYRLALQRHPALVAIHENLSAALFQLGRYAEAVASYRQIVIQQPTADALGRLGSLLHAAGRLDEAAVNYRRAIELKPDSAEAMSNLALVLRARGHCEEAVALHQRALALDPHRAETHTNLGAALFDLDQIDDAIDCYRRALDLQPTSSAAHVNLCAALNSIGRYDEAIASARRAIELQSDSADAHNNLGITLGLVGRHDEAIACYQRAITHKPEFAESHFNLGQMQLLKGDFARGWDGLEWRRRMNKLSKIDRELPQPLWTGTPLDGRTLFVHDEWGLGDTLQFVRYVAAIGGGAVVVECQQPLVRLMRRSFPNLTWITDRDPLPPIDVHCGMLSLPGIFHARCGELGEPYLTADANDVETWRGRLAGDLLKVGVRWAGSPTYRNDRNRSMAPELLTPLMAVPGVNLYSLQKEPTPQAGLDVVDCSGDLGDFADTAGLVANLDLVISVDTSVAHLAGAMGKPVWTMLPFSPDWRWRLDRDDTPWYPSMRLFRQPKLGDWPSVVGKVALALHSFVRA